MGGGGGGGGAGIGEGGHTGHTTRAPSTGFCLLQGTSLVVSSPRSYWFSMRTVTVRVSETFSWTMHKGLVWIDSKCLVSTKKDLDKQCRSRPGPRYSKLTMSLVNDSLKFTSSDTQIC